jgi:hypothetical protein
MFDNMTEEFRTSHAVPEHGMGQEPFKLFANAPLLYLTSRSPRMRYRLMIY